MNFVTEMIHDNTYFSEFNNFLDGYQIVELNIGSFYKSAMA